VTERPAEGCDRARAPGLREWVSRDIVNGEQIRSPDQRGHRSGTLLRAGRPPPWVSKTLVHKLHHRWLAEGDAALEPRSRRPTSSPNRTPPVVAARVLQLRDHLQGNGLDAGADTIAE
jgi:hypothetical protein